ncbi:MULTISPECIES: hypothetical protein [unclassified Agrobacterium]|uniref:hypothetical protein n=1 Tax=unclassified Agrobacterium TaxID=2632611 RepID=UPI002448AA49|nr:MULTISPECIES: hypothetical protein [unclassified Agrobacterium]MDH0615911.1 hypothetical protein [Agrobacterium sp. GD03872]MDH0698026.1 hypothetical protein [Agrobacterium sp. GD03871]MDH1061111.1 hypothetical protein [Agrobacterium sp. GD03992]MDH2211857.1 hypothetical protein [Agrobacterium sp. GD03643]MDH2221249.1 hypothetical protein [Agrobacterium sp. GD03638]
MTAREQENRQREKARVARLEDITRRCKGDRWRFDTDGDQTHIIARRSTGESVILGTLYADALPDEVELLTGALENTILLLTLRERAKIAFRSGQSQPQERQPTSRLRDGNFAANAAMLCADTLFHRFLEQRQHPAQSRTIHNKEHADTVLKSLIGITSKTQLNREERAQAAFIDLRSDFELWKGGRS